jgi:hypothetical protein
MYLRPEYREFIRNLDPLRCNKVILLQREYLFEEQSYRKSIKIQSQDTSNAQRLRRLHRLLQREIESLPANNAKIIEKECLEQLRLKRREADNLVNGAFSALVTEKP